MKIEQFDRSNLKELSKDLSSSIEALSKKYGITIAVGNIRFSAGEATIKVIARATESKVVSNLFATEMQTLYKLRANEEINGKTLIRHDRKKFKFPFIYHDRATGKTYKCSYEQAKKLFG